MHSLQSNTIILLNVIGAFYIKWNFNHCSPTAEFQLSRMSELQAQFNPNATQVVRE